MTHFEFDIEFKMARMHKQNFRCLICLNTCVLNIELIIIFVIRDCD